MKKCLSIKTYTKKTVIYSFMLTQKNLNSYFNQIVILSPLQCGLNSKMNQHLLLTQIYALGQYKSIIYDVI